MNESDSCASDKGFDLPMTVCDHPCAVKTNIELLNFGYDTLLKEAAVHGIRKKDKKQRVRFIQTVTNHQLQFLIVIALLCRCTTCSFSMNRSLQNYGTTISNFTENPSAKNQLKISKQMTTVQAPHCQLIPC